MGDFGSDEEESAAAAKLAFRWSNAAPDAERELERLAESDTDGLINHPALQYDFGIEDRHREAAIYLEEGANNDKFMTHPTTPSQIQAYWRSHNSYLYTFQLVYALSLMAMAIFEGPGPESFVFEFTPYQHATIELLLVLCICINLKLQADFLGSRIYRKHFFYIIQMIIVLVIIGEAIATFSTNSHCFRLSRMFRPVIFLSCHHMADVRRVLRQTAMCVVPVVDLVLLLFFNMFIFSILGFYLFGPTKIDPKFATLNESFISLYVLLTTANFPTVMMDAFAKSRWYFLFFFVYLLLELYFLQNIVLAVVFDSYRKEELKKFRALWLHQRMALRLCFRLLCDKRSGNSSGMGYEAFANMMKYRNPGQSALNTRLLFMALNKSGSGTLQLSEFNDFFQAEQFVFEKHNPDFDGILRAEPTLWSRFLKEATYIATHQYFEWAINLVIIVNSGIIVYQAGYYDATIKMYDHQETGDGILPSDHLNVFFLTMYWLEVVIKMLGWGILGYFWNGPARGWNRFDFTVTLMSTLGLAFGAQVNLFIAARSIRLLRLFKASGRFRNTLDIVIALLPRLWTLSIALFGCVYYFFAIIGMESFAGAVSKPNNSTGDGCCMDSSNYGGMQCGAWPGTNASGGAYNLDQGYYYLNNFDSIMMSYVTLFELMIVNNNDVIMDGFINGMVVAGWNAEHQWRNQMARAFFIIWYIMVVLIMLNVVISYVIDFFVTRMEYLRARGNTSDLDADELTCKVKMPLSIFNRHASRGQTIELGAINEGGGLSTSQMIEFTGTRNQTVTDCQTLIYSDELVKWALEDEIERNRSRTLGDSGAANLTPKENLYEDGNAGIVLGDDTHYRKDEYDAGSATFQGAVEAIAAIHEESELIKLRAELDIRIQRSRPTNQDL